MHRQTKLDTIRWGIIGCGNVTEVKSGPAFRKVRHSELIAVMRRTTALAEDYARRHRVDKWYDNAAALIQDPDINAVYIATPPSSHKAYTLLAAEAGKHVYVEKPMALNYQECQEMITACQKAGVSLFVAYYRRALARFLKIKDLLHGGAIGTVRHVSVNLYTPGHSNSQQNEVWRVRPEIAGGGYFVDLASHMLNFLEDALGPIEQISGFASNQAGCYSAEDMVSASFRFASGVQGTGNWGFNAFARHDLTDIIGSEGMLSFVTFDDSPIVLKTAAGQQEYFLPYPEHVQLPLIETVVAALRGQGSCPSTPESAARTNWLMDEVLTTFKA